MKKELRVRMFGGFSIQYGEKKLTENVGRTKKVWALVEFLLAHRGKDVSQENLMEALWGDEEFSNPLGTLKNLVYRARKQLNELMPPGETVSFIQFERSTYVWNSLIPCRMDTAEFEALWKKAGDERLAKEERVRLYQAAAALYQGEFLPKSSYMDWVVSKSAYYSTIYNECVLSLCEMLVALHRYDELVVACERAVLHCPLSEDIHQALLYGYYKTGQPSKAIPHYERLRDAFYNELGVELSEATVQLYRTIRRKIHNLEMDLHVIQKDLQESSQCAGAFYCDYDVFRNIYRMLARWILRTGQSIYIALFTFTDSQDELPDSSTIPNVMAVLRSCVCSQLRRGDVVSTYSSTQLVVMLPLSRYEDGLGVLERITRFFMQTYQGDDVKIHTNLRAIEPADSYRDRS